jgi:preprotein translocase subunit YajC
LNELRAGSEVVTIGGLHGTITSIDEKKVTLKVASDVELTFNRSAIGHVKEGQQ